MVYYFGHEKRREVARRLRGARYGCRSWERALCDALGVNTETAGLDMLDRLSDLIDPSCDRDALLAIADEMDNPLWQDVMHQRPAFRRKHIMSGYARRIREALGYDGDDLSVRDGGCRS